MTGIGDIVPGSLMIGVKEDTPQDEVIKGLEGKELKNVKGSGFFYTGACAPFQEPSVCQRLEKELAFLKYADPNRVVRLIDFKPGWTVKSLL